MVIAILVIEVLREGLASLGPTIGIAALLYEVFIAFLTQPGEVGFVQKPEGAGLLGQEVCQLGAHADLNTLHGVEHHQTELPVEHVHVPGALECGALPELV